MENSNATNTLHAGFLDYMASRATGGLNTQPLRPARTATTPGLRTRRTWALKKPNSGNVLNIGYLLSQKVA